MMGASVSQSIVNGFFEAYAKRDLDAILDFLAEDVDWRFPGPVEIFPFCGRWRGKAAVIAHFTRLAPSLFSLRRMEPEILLIDGDRAAAFSKMTSVESQTGRILTYHCAHFVVFREAKVVTMQAVADTFSLIDQLQTVEIVIGTEPAAAAAAFCKVKLS